MKIPLLLATLLVALASSRTCDLRPNSPIRTCAFVSGEFSDAVPRSGVQSEFQYLCYAGFDTTAACAKFPSSYRNTCPCTSSQTSLISTYPNQLRWGVPWNQQPSSVKFPSGFGWRGAQGVAVPAPGQIFYLGEAAHFNYIIEKAAVRTWTMVLVVTFDVEGRAEQTLRFDLALEMDETENTCSGSGCENAAFWGNKGPNDPDIWPACLDCGMSTFIIRRLNSCGQGSSKCCPYVTVSQYTIDPPGANNAYSAAGPCSDRVWTLTRFAQSVPLDIGDGFEYTVSFAGFTAPGSPSTPVPYFISQENRQTPAEIWGSLVRRCPSTSSCPQPAVLELNAAGDACVCKCPAQLTCPAGQALDATCQCVCVDNGQCGPCGKPVRTGSTCGCQCNSTAACCGTGSRQVASGPSCQCACPSNVCTAPRTLSNPNDITCPCRCPDCPGSQVLTDANACTCACPATACQAPKVVTNPNSPSCPCGCPTSSCPNANHVVDQTTCQCGCPAPVAQCVAPKQFNPSTCQCACPVACPAGQIQQQSDCSCKCPANSCTAPKVLSGDGSANPSCGCECPSSLCTEPGSVLVDPYTSGACECTCPSNHCLNGGQLTDPNAPIGSCSCVCPPCAGNWQADDRCQCNVCPATPPQGSGAATWDDFCAASLGAGNVWDATTCSCYCPQYVVCGCRCQAAEDDCWIQAVVDCVAGGPSSCTPTPRNVDQPCGEQAANVCLNPLCDDAGNCVFNPLDCAPVLAALGPDAQCFSVACDPVEGCVTTFFDGQSCQLDLEAALGGDSEAAVRAQCYVAQCANDQCSAVFNADADCTLSYAATDLPCVDFACQGDDATGTCVATLVNDASCSFADLSAVIPAGDDAQCYVAQCAADRGDGSPGCVATPVDDIVCQPPGGTSGYDHDCFSSLCTAGKCVVTTFDGTACSLPEVGQCQVSQCVAGVCSAVFDPTQADDSCGLDLSNLGDAAQCYVAQCVEADGTCAAVFQEGFNCTVVDLAALVGGAGNVPCFTTVCQDDTCAPVALPDGTRCFEPTVDVPLGGDQQCYVPSCQTGVCAWAPSVGASCSDADPCSIAPNTTDSSSGLRSDECVADPANDTIVTCQGSANRCDVDRADLEAAALAECLLTETEKQCEKELNDKYRQKKNCSQICQPASTSYYCVDPCVFKASNSQSDAIAIALGTVGGVCLFAAAAVVLVFAYVRWGHKYVMKLLSSDSLVAAAQESPLYEGVASGGASGIYEGSI